MTEVRRLEGADGSLVTVHTSRGPDTMLTVYGRDRKQGAVVTLSPAARDALREALDRAAMPGVRDGE